METNTIETISICPSLGLSGLDSVKSVKVPHRSTPEITFSDNKSGGESSLLKTDRGCRNLINRFLLQEIRVLVVILLLWPQDHYPLY